MIRRSTALAVLVSALSVAVAAGCSSDERGQSAGQTPSATTSRLVDLERIDDLRAAFNAEPGVPRLILLLSPT